MKKEKIRVIHNLSTNNPIQSHYKFHLTYYPCNYFTYLLQINSNIYTGTCSINEIKRRHLSMADQAALQEAIQRARQLAAKISQNAPVKRTASEMDDSHSIGTVKVTLAYEKPANAEPRGPQQQDNNNQHNHSNNQRPSSNHREPRDRDRDDRDSGYSGSNGNLGSGACGNSFPRGGSSTSSQPMLYGQHQQQQQQQHAPTMLNAPYQSAAPSSGGPGSGGDDKIELIIPHAVIGLVIGKGGENIKRIQNESGAMVRVDPNTVDEKGNKMCTITGTKQAVDEAHRQVQSVIENAATNKRPRMAQDGGGGGGGAEQYRMKIPAQRTGAIIGKGGETIKSIKQQSGCDIELDKHAKECGPDESVFIIRGSSDRIAKARALIEARLAQRGRDGDRPGPKGVATGANAAPVAQFTDLPTAATAAYPGKLQNIAIVVC